MYMDDVSERDMDKNEERDIDGSRYDMRTDSGTRKRMCN